MKLTDKFKGLDLTPDEQQAPSIRAWCGQMPGIQQIAKCRPRTHYRVAGVVKSIKIIPAPNASLLEIEIFDGTDHLTGVWLGRRSIRGIDLGRRITLEGAIGELDGDDNLTMVNPAYELLSA